MTPKVCWPLFAVLLFVASADAAESSAAEALIAPGKVALGMSSAALKAVRPKAFDGPQASRPNDPQQRKWPTMMEVTDLGQPSQVSFWYLFANDRLTALLRTRNLVLVPPAGRIAEASSAYDALYGLLGPPRQESLLRKGDSSFVPVRADVWTDDVARLTFYFIATTKEVTTAVVAPSDFPMEQVLIRPDPKRFEVEDKAAQTVADLPRSQPQDGDGAANIKKSPTLTLPSWPKPMQAEPLPSVNQTKAQQASNNVMWWPWALVGAITLGFLWMSWRATSKSHRDETK